MSSPPARRRTLQIRLGRPRPPEQESHAQQSHAPATPSTPFRGIRISLKRRPQHKDHHQHEDNEGDHEDRSVKEQAQNDNDIDNDQDDDDDDDDEEDHDDENEDDEDAENQDQDDNNQQADLVNQGWNTARSRPIKRLRSKGLYDAIPKLLENFKRRDSYKFFWEPVNLQEVPNYLEFISEPMDLGTIEDKINRRLYSHMDEFRHDFLLVVRNAQTFNPPGTIYHGEGRKLENWGTRAIERESLSINDNGFAGAKGDQLRAASEIQDDEMPEEQQQQQHQSQAAAPARNDPQTLSERTRSGKRSAFRISGKGAAGLEALIEAARLKPGDEARAAAAIALVQTGRPGTQISIGPFEHGDDAMDHDDDSDVEHDGEDDEEHDPRRSSSLRGVSRERSVTADHTGANSTASRRLGSARIGAASPATPGPNSSTALRAASPEALRKRLAMVSGPQLAAFASPAGPGPAAPKSTPAGKVKQRHRLGPPGTPKRLSAAPGTSTPSSAVAAVANSTLPAPVATAALAPTYTYTADGSIDAEDIDDANSFVTLRSAKRPILMPTVESIHPIPFVPQHHSETSVTTNKEKNKEKDKDKDKDKEKEKEKEKEKDKEEKEEDEGDKDGDKDKMKDKADKDPLSTLPPMRLGAPDPLFCAIAPEPESISANYNYDTKALPVEMQSMPFLLPSGDQDTAVIIADGKRKRIGAPDAGHKGKRPRLPLAWENISYSAALQNELRPKKQKDRELEKEKETLEDWTHYRPPLTRLLGVTDLGLYGTMLPEHAMAQDQAVPLKPWATDGDVSTAVSSSILDEIKSRTVNPGVSAMDVLQSVCRARRSLAPEHVREVGKLGSQELRNTVYGGPRGEAYARSLADFVDGAMSSAFVSDEDTIECERREAEAAQLAAQAQGQEAPPIAASSRSTPESESDTGGGGLAELLRRKMSPSSDQATTPEIKSEDDEESVGALESSRQTSAPVPGSDEIRRPLKPLEVPLDRYVHDKVLKPLTGGMLDVLHLVAGELGSSRSVEVEQLKQALLSATFLVPSATGTGTGTGTIPSPAVDVPMQIESFSELAWLQSQPELVKVLEQASMDVDGLGSTIHQLLSSTSS